MILGNSFGKNKGKKYFIKGKHDINPDVLYAEKAEEFNIWFGENYNELLRTLKDKYVYDIDAVNDTYVKVYENILYSGINIQCYRSYFFRSYYTNYINDSMRKNRFTQLLPNFDKSDDGTNHQAELETSQKELQTDIFDYIYRNYEKQEFEIFKMYVSLKPAVNYLTLANITGLKPHNIQHTISNIKKDICQHRDFDRRRREVL